MKKGKRIIIILLVFSALGWTSEKHDKSIQTNWQDRVFHQSSADGQPREIYYKGVITIKLKPGADDFSLQTGAVHFGIQSLDDKIATYRVYLLEKRFRNNPGKCREGLPDLSRLYKISFPESFQVKEVVQAFSSDPNVEYAEAIPILHLAEVPDDSYYSQLQHLPQIFAPQAWAVHKGENGEEEISIAVIDSGVDWDHVDLRENIWQNLAEDADGDNHTMEYNGAQWVLDPGDLNNIDDDGNGFVDDLIGWNFITDNGDPNPIEGHPQGHHGSHCAGISNGVTNNGTGIASISWNLSLMPVCVFGGVYDYGYEGIIYAAENGADIISNSWGSGVYSMAHQEAVNYATGLGSIIIAAAGNNHHSLEFYPACYQNVISVASVSGDDVKADYSNFCFPVDISAPGGGTEGGILSTIPGNAYMLLSGTSMATPCIAGCLGLLKSYHPDWSNAGLITQLLGTADNIDSLNPDYANMLGSGRVNAYRMLTEEDIMPFLKLELISSLCDDANGNKINEQGELVALDFNLRNYMQCYGSGNVSVTLSTEDTGITIINGSCSVGIPPDDSFSIENQFQILVGLNTPSHYARLTLHFEAEIPITMGEDIDFGVLVAPSGIFVYEGEENARDYSGKLIASFLERLGFDYTYSNNYPATLQGFETVFLSHGNFGYSNDKGTLFTEEQSLMVQEFLENGGNVYIEMGGMFKRIVSFGNNTAMKQLFGVNQILNPFGSNLIDSLQGVENTPAEGMLFTGSSQLYNAKIDKLIPASGAIIPFAENNYGNVSIMNEEESTYGCKSFYLSYALAELYDRDVISSKYNVLLKIMDFFGYARPQGYLLSNFITDKTTGAPPLLVHFTDISISDPSYPVSSWQWDFNDDGTIDSYDQHPSWTYNDTTTHSVKLVTFNGLNTDTLIMEDLIRFNYGCLVYDGDPDGIDYSGTFIRDYLLEHGYSVTYRNIFPENPEGFDAVFLSFGNSGSGNTILDEKMAVSLMGFLQNGGFVYLEGADALGYNQATNYELLNLFGLNNASDGSDNPLDSLFGQLSSAITHDMVFTGNNQAANKWIDTYTPLPNAITSFIESSYGIVAVENAGPNGCRTFCFSYSLAHLTDGESPGTREELLQRILNFFDMYTAVPEPYGNHQILACHVFPNPVTTNVTFSYYLPEQCQLIFKIFDSSGRQIGQLTSEQQSKGRHQVQWNTNGLPAGIYFYRISTIGNHQAALGKILVIR
jgi:serine protease